MKRKELRQCIENKGYSLIRSKRHFVFKNHEGNTIIMPNHNNISKHVIKSILKKVG